MSMRAFLGMQILYQKLLLLAIYIFMDVPYPVNPGVSIRDRLGIQNNHHKSLFRKTANIKGVPFF